MSLAPGVRLGAYEVVSPLGAGGMGEVYRARDPRLKREVAVKILRGDRSASAEARARFEREAHAVAALSHPNIIAIHDIGTENNQLYVVTELLEGETLRARLERGPLPWRKAVEMAAAIADGLAAAHGKGVIHRDIKPANIFLTNDGRVKVLDFGIAKLRDATEPEQLDTTLSQTGPGALGTVAYMAPEQAAGKTVDARSDLFALGCVLYEMVDGRRPFQRPTAAETMAAVIKDDQPELSTVPSELRRVVDHSLEKDPEKRFQSAHDFAFALRMLREEATSSSASIPIRSSRQRLAWLATASVGASLLVLGVRTVLHEPARAPLIQMHVLPPENHQIGFTPSVSPDGRHVTFAARGPDGKATLWVRSLNALTARRIGDAADWFVPFWSPDSRWVAFFANSKLSKINVSDGTFQDICRTGQTVLGGVWLDDSTIVFPRGMVGPLYRVSASGGDPTPFTELDTSRGETSHRFPVVLPGGRNVMYMSITENPFSQHLYMTPADGAKSRLVTEAAGIDSPFYADGYLLFLRGNNLMAASFDEQGARLTGDPVIVAQDVSAFSVGGSTLAYIGAVEHQLAWLDRHGRQIEALPIRGRFGVPKISRDGGRVAIQKLDSQNRGDIWIYDLVRHTGTPE